MWCPARKLKQTEKDAAPTVLMTVGVQSERSALKSATEGNPSVFGRAVVCFTRRSRGAWTATKEIECPRWEDVWKLCDETFKGRRRVYVVSSNALDDLTLLHFWQEVERGSISLRKRDDAQVRVKQGVPKLGNVGVFPLVFGDRCDIIGFERSHTVYRWVSVTNWADLSLVDMAHEVGYTLPPEGSEFDRWRAHGWPAEDQARMILEYVKGAMAWWVKEGCGVWKDTPGAAAWASFKRQGGDTGILEHSHEPTLILEDRAAFGGRAAAYYCGPIGDPNRWHELSGAPTPRPVTTQVLGQAHRYDVRSMYPTLLRDQLYPVKLLEHTRDISPQMLKLWLDGSCVIAAVRIRTDEAEYPLKGEQGPIYPVGQFDTVLTTPDLIRAIERGHLLRVYEASLYKAGRPFHKWATWVLALRTLAGMKGNAAHELYVKTLANALSGRLGRKHQGWFDCPSAVPRQWWGQWVYDDGSAPTPLLYRAICGRVQRMEREEYRPGTLGACYSHLTAYGRSFMLGLREKIGHESVLWQDTDALLLTNAGRAKLLTCPEYDEKEFGHMRFELTATDGQITTAKHYWIDGRWILAGVATGFGIDSAGNAAEVRTANPVRKAQEPSACATYQFLQHIDIGAIEPGLRVGEDGWTIPPKVWVGERPKKEPKPEPGVLPFFALPHEQRSYQLSD